MNDLIEVSSRKEMEEGFRNLAANGNTVDYKKWFFGHYHVNQNVSAEEIAIYEHTNYIITYKL